VKKRADQKSSINAQTTKKRIMNESIKLFARKGYAATSIKDISEAASVNIAAVNYHFESKENLYRQLLNSFAETGIAKIEQILKAPKNVDEFKVRLEMFLSSGVDNIIEYPDLHRMLMKNIDLMPQLSEETFHKTFEKFHHVMAAFFESAQKNGIVRKELDHKLIAQFLDSQIFSLIHKAAIERTLKKDIDDPKFRRRWLGQTLDLFFNGALEK
jgi:AcrR family transcriptional regulator